MTPELKIACEVVFQEHKTSHYPINWGKDVFRGRISIGLSEMAKETLLKKKVIYFPNPSKKTITILNPSAAAATTFEEAAEMIHNKVPSLVSEIVEKQPVYVATPVSSFIKQSSKPAHRLIKIAGQSETAIAKEKWYLKPLFYYIVWPACAAVLGVAIAYVMTEYVAMVFQ